MSDPGPVGVVAGRVKVIESGLRPALPALRNCVFSLPPVSGQAQKTSTATPWVVSKPLPLITTELPCNSVVSTLATAKSGSRLVGASGSPSSPVMLGNPAAAEPCNRAKPGLDCGKET